MTHYRDPEAFLRRLFKTNSYAKKPFDRLVELGCEPKMLRDWLFQISASLSMLRSRKIHGRYLAAWDLKVGLSKDEFRKLHDRLLSIAGAILDLSHTELAIVTKLMGFIREGLPFEIRLYNFLLAKQFDNLPLILVEYADSLKEAYENLAKYYTPKKWDGVAAFEAEWLDNVKDATGKFHFHEIAILLEAGFDILKDTLTDVSKRFTDEAVRRRYRRFRRNHSRTGLKYPRWSNPIKT